MRCGARLLLLVSGLCVVTSYVSSVQLYGTNALNPNEDVTRQLGELQQEKLNLETHIAHARSPILRFQLERDLKSVNNRIEHRKETARVAYTDYLKIGERLREQLEIQRNAQIEYCEREKKQLRKQLHKEKDNMRKQLERAENEREKLEALAMESDKVSKECEQKLKKTKDLHARVLEAFAVTGQTNFSPVRLPYLDSINGLKRTMSVITSVTTKKQRVDQLSITKEKLQNLFQKLYAEGRFSDSKPYKELQRDTDTEEAETVELRDQLFEQRAAVLEKMLNTDLADYEEEDLIALQQVNLKITETDETMQDIARRRAYLYAISQVIDLIKECS